MPAQAVVGDVEASAHAWSSEVSRFDLGGGETLRLFTVEGRQRGERLGTTVVSWSPKGGGPAEVWIAAPSFDASTDEFGRLLRVHFQAGEEVVIREVDGVGHSVPHGKIGAAMSNRGDFDGDGVAEIVVGSPYIGISHHRAGAVTLLNLADGLTAHPLQILHGHGERSNFGASLAAVGDVNGDGDDDLVVGAPLATREAESEGAVFLFLGTPHGLDPESRWTSWGGQKGMRWGEVIRAAGDVNGDGYADVLVAAPRWGQDLSGYGEVRLYLGCPEGLRAEPAWVYRGQKPYAKAGLGLFGGVDLNGDGFADVLVGEPNSNVPGGGAGMGEVHFFAGSIHGLSLGPDWTWAGTEVGGGFGHSISVVGDMNGDGWPELAIGAPFVKREDRHQGVLRIFTSDRTGFLTPPIVEIFGGVSSGRYGFHLATLGDVDGDGLADLGIGSPDFVTRDHANGRCDILFGSRGLGTRPMALEAMPFPAFRVPLTNTLSAASKEQLQPPPVVGVVRFDSPHLAWFLLGVALVAMALVVAAWRSVGVQLSRVRRRLHDFVGSELSQISQPAPGFQRVTDELRALVWAVKQESATVSGLVKQITDWAWDYASERGLTLRLELPETQIPPARLNNATTELAQAFVRIALSNVIEHAGATRAVLRIGLEGNHLTLEVEDNGIGLHEWAVHERHLEERGSSGLRNLCQRVRQSQGTLSLGSQPGAGTRVTVRLPLARPPADGWGWITRPFRAVNLSPIPLRSGSLPGKGTTEGEPS